jgi:tRNA pseudouridine38-40 synthase
MRLKFLVAYDGRAFAGWQSQPNGQAVQDVIEVALAKIAGSRVVLHGSGRTDAGVHALGQCAHADVPDASGLKPADWLRALNANLPEQVRIMRCTRAAGDFHARFSAKGKIYRYTIRNAQVLPPLEFGRVWHVPHALDFEKLQRAAKLFIGRHDFAAFAANRGKPDENAVRTIRRVDVARGGSLITLTFEGEGFLYKMVRMLTAATMRAAQGREDLGALRERLAKGGPKWNHVAPAEGLCLVKVLY